MEYKEVGSSLEMCLVNNPKELCNGNHILHIDIYKGRFIAWCFACNAKYILRDYPNHILCQLNEFSNALSKLPTPASPSDSEESM